MTPEERAKNILDAKTFPYDLSCEMTEEAEETLIDLIKFQIREAQREAVEKALEYTAKCIEADGWNSFDETINAKRHTEGLALVIRKIKPEKVLGE